MQLLLLILPLIPLIGLLWFVFSSFGERDTIGSTKQKADEDQQYVVRFDCFDVFGIRQGR
jgi:hypothetical protein